LPNYFSGDLDLAKPRLNFPRGGGVWGGIRVGFSDFGGKIGGGVYPLYKKCLNYGFLV